MFTCWLSVPGSQVSVSLAELAKRNERVNSWQLQLVAAVSVQQLRLPTDFLFFASLRVSDCCGLNCAPTGELRKSTRLFFYPRNLFDDRFDFTDDSVSVCAKRKENRKKQTSRKKSARRNSWKIKSTFSRWCCPHSQLCFSLYLCTSTWKPDPNTQFPNNVYHVDQVFTGSIFFMDTRVIPFSFLSFAIATLFR